MVSCASVYCTARFTSVWQLIRCFKRTRWSREREALLGTSRSLRKQASLPFTLSTPSQFGIINSQRRRQNDCYHHCGRSEPNSLKVIDGKTSGVCRDGDGKKRMNWGKWKETGGISSVLCNQLRQQTRLAARGEGGFQTDVWFSNQDS